MAITVDEAEDIVNEHQAETTHSEIDISIISEEPKLTAIVCQDCGERLALIDKE